MTPRPKPRSVVSGGGKLHGKVALITGGDSGIGRAVAILFATEGADVAIVYLNEHDDAADTKRRVEAEGRRCVTFAGDVGREPFCQEVVQQTVAAFGQLDILVNNAAEQHPQDSLAKITAEQLERTFRLTYRCSPTRKRPATSPCWQCHHQYHLGHGLSEAVRICSTTLPPKGRLSPLRAPWRSRWPTRVSA